MTKVSRALAVADKALSSEAVRAAVRGRRDYVTLAIDALRAGGFITVDIGGPGRPTWHAFVKPFPPLVDADQDLVGAANDPDLTYLLDIDTESGGQLPVVDHPSRHRPDTRGEGSERDASEHREPLPDTGGEGSRLDSGHPSPPRPDVAPGAVAEPHRDTPPPSGGSGGGAGPTSERPKRMILIEMRPGGSAPRAGDAGHDGGHDDVARDDGDSAPHAGTA